MSGCGWLDEMHDAGNDVVELQWLPDGTAFFDRVADVADDVVRAACIRRDIREDLAELHEVDVSAVDESLAGAASLMIPESGWFTSCAMEAVISPSRLTRLSRSISSRRRCASSAAALRAEMSTIEASMREPCGARTGFNPISTGNSLRSLRTAKVSRPPGHCASLRIGHEFVRIRGIEEDEPLRHENMERFTDEFVA